MANTDTPALRPRLVVTDAAKAIETYIDVFGATEVARYTDDNGKIVHAELTASDAAWTLKDEDGADRAPTTEGGYPVLLMLEVDDVDGVAERMTAAGGKVIFPVSDSEYGRGGRVQDPFGHVWMLSERTGPSASLTRDNGISYVFIPAQDVRASAEFYRTVFGWDVHGLDRAAPGFSDGTGHVAGKWVTDQEVSRTPGLLPYVYVDDVDAIVERITAHGGSLVKAPYPEGNLTVARFTDPAGNVMGIWHRTDLD